MNLFNNMINGNTKFKNLNCQYLNKEQVLNLNIVPNNILNGGTRYLNWIISDDKLYHFKIFDFNDFIGQKLCEEINLDCVKYDLAMIRGNIQTISESFIDNSYDYYNIKNIHVLLNNREKLNHNFYYFIELLYKNGYKKDVIVKLIDNILKMSAVDFFSRQNDRFYNNYMFKANINDIALAPLYDFGESFSFSAGDYMDYGFGYQYNNELFNISWCFNSDILKKYPQFKLYLEKLYYINLLEFIEEICAKYKLSLNQELIEIYKKEEKQSKMRIKEII